MAHKVYLSPSNHGVNQNKCLKSGCYEDKHTRPIAEACAKYLKASGVEAKVAAAATSVLNGARTRESDNWGAELYVPIHTNAAGASARYLLFMFYADNSTYRKIFNAVAPKLEAIYPEKTKAHYSVRTDLYEVRNPKAKTLYCEMGFHTNKTDCDKFIHNSDAVGKALAQGICAYFGVAFKGSSTGSSGNSEAKPSAGGKKSIDEIAKEVIAGKWGNGSERVQKLKAAGYDADAVQDRVNEILTGKSSTSGKKSVDTVAQEVIAGKWGNGSERVQKLKAAGYDADAVQDRVNEILTGKSSTSSKKSVDTIAREVIAGKWGNGSDRVKKLKAAGYDATAVQNRVNELLK